MSSRCIVSRIGVQGLGVAIAILVAASSAWAQGMTLTRPIGDWLSAQGSCSWVPKDFGANYISWTGRTPPNGDVDVLATMDYAGVASNPTITGTVIERALPDGRTLVKVKVVARDALTSVSDFTGGVLGSVLYGPTLGNCSFEAEYVVARAPGDPMEDVFAALFFDPKNKKDWRCRPTPTSLPFEDLHFVGFAGNAQGQCRDGSASQLSVVQTGLIGTAFQNGFRGALGDAFPAEFVGFQPECQ